jgi:hypothetical protein
MSEDEFISLARQALEDVVAEAVRSSSAAEGAGD